MKMDSLPWITSNITGPETATIVDATAVARIMKRAKNVTMIIGSEVNEKMVKYAKKMQKLGIVIIPSYNSAKFFGNTRCTTVLEAIKEIKEEEKYDLVIFLGSRYSFTSQLLSALKNSKIKTLDISGKFQPNASYSFDNLSEKEWEKSMKELIKLLEVS